MATKNVGQAENGSLRIPTVLGDFEQTADKQTRTRPGNPPHYHRLHLLQLQKELHRTIEMESIDHSRFSFSNSFFNLFFRNFTSSKIDPSSILPTSSKYFPIQSNPLSLSLRCNSRSRDVARKWSIDLSFIRLLPFTSHFETSKFDYSLIPMLRSRRIEATRRERRREEIREGEGGRVGKGSRFNGARRLDNVGKREGRGYRKIY